MTFDEFKKDFLMFLSDSRVNLGRLTSMTRRKFLSTAEEKFESFVPKDNETPQPDSPVAAKNDRLVCLKPKQGSGTLNIGKGVHAMTPSDSMRADEQLGRSPFGKQSKDE